MSYIAGKQKVLLKENTTEKEDTKLIFLTVQEKWGLIISLMGPESGFSIGAMIKPVGGAIKPLKTVQEEELQRIARRLVVKGFSCKIT